MKNITGPDLCYCLAARRGSRYMTRLYDRHLAASGLSVSQFSLLALVNEHPDIAISALAELMVMERTTILRALKPLRAAGLLLGEPKGAKAILEFRLSIPGEAKLKEAHGYWLDAQKELEDTLGAENAITLRNRTLDAVFPD